MKDANGSSIMPVETIPDWLVSTPTELQYGLQVADGTGGVPEFIDLTREEYIRAQAASCETQTINYSSPPGAGKSR